jgi:hypothetical protein
MRGHSASKDARERAGDPRINLSSEMDCIETQACPSFGLNMPKSGKPDLGVKPGNDGRNFRLHYCSDNYGLLRDARWRREGRFLL